MNREYSTITSNPTETLNKLNTLDILTEMTPKPRKHGVKKRNIVLKIETYERLQRYLLELIQRRGDPRITFDEAINALLDEHEGRDER